MTKAAGNVGESPLGKLQASLQESKVAREAVEANLDAELSPAERKRQRDIERKRQKRAEERAAREAEQPSSFSVEQLAELDRPLPEITVIDEIEVPADQVFLTGQANPADNGWSGGEPPAPLLENSPADPEVLEQLNGHPVEFAGDAEESVTKTMVEAQQPITKDDLTEHELGWIEGAHNDPLTELEQAVVDTYLEQSSDEELSLAAKSKQALIEQIVARMPADAREAEREKLRPTSASMLRSILESINQIMGNDLSPTTALKELDTLWAARCADPIHRQAMKVFNEGGAEFVKLADAIARTIGDDVVVNKLKNSNFKNTATEAVRDLSILSTLIGSIEPHLRYYTRLEEIPPEQFPQGFSVPRSMAKLEWILRHASIHLEVNTKREASWQTRLDELNKDLASRGRAYDNVKEQYAELQRHASNQFAELGSETEYTIYSRTNRQFLASTMLPHGKNPDNTPISIRSFYWTNNPNQALRFDESAAALATIDNLSHRGGGRRREGLPEIIGVPLGDIALATTVLRLPE